MIEPNRTDAKVIFALTLIHFTGDFYVSFINPLLPVLVEGIVMVQKLAPQGKSMVSSLMMGLAMGVGGMLMPPVGGLADLFSLREVLYGLALIPLFCIGPISCFPEKQLREQPLAG